MIFEWDRRKAATNRTKHGVDFDEAASAFLDPLAVTYPDPDHSRIEARFLTFGHSARGRVLAVSHMEIDDEHLRIISARKATKREAHDYQEEI